MRSIEVTGSPLPARGSSNVEHGSAVEEDTSDASPNRNRKGAERHVSAEGEVAGQAVAPFWLILSAPLGARGRAVARFVVDAFTLAREADDPQAAVEEIFGMIEAAWEAVRPSEQM